MLDAWPPVFFIPGITSVLLSSVVHQLKVSNTHFWEGGFHSQKSSGGTGTAYTRGYSGPCTYYLTEQNLSGLSADIIVKKVEHGKKDEYQGEDAFRNLKMTYIGSVNVFNDYDGSASITSKGKGKRNMAKTSTSSR